LAENLAPSLKAAEWRDRADAALADIDEIDLRDLRSVVVGADTAATDDESRALAATLREKLGERVEREQADWLAEIRLLIGSGRTIRALRLSSRPPKAGSPIPADLAKELADATVASVDDDTQQDRWGALLDALAFSPIRALVSFPKLPEQPSEELLTTVRAVADRIPAIATAMGIEPPAPGARPSRQRRRPGPSGGPTGPTSGENKAAGAKASARPIPPPPPPAEPRPAEPTTSVGAAPAELPAEPLAQEPTDQEPPAQEPTEQVDSTAGSPAEHAATTDETATVAEDSTSIEGIPSEAGDAEVAETTAPDEASPAEAETPGEVEQPSSTVDETPIADEE
jgi:hypothetical protein